jgi:hypothetical protein
VARPGRSGLDLIGETLVTPDRVGNGKEVAAVAARKVARLLRDLETYVCRQSDIIIDYATVRHEDEPISTAVTESTVQWLLHRRMDAQQHMRWSPRGAHLMLKVRTATANGRFERTTLSPSGGLAVRSGARREDPQVLDGLMRIERTTDEQFQAFFARRHAIDFCGHVQPPSHGGVPQRRLCRP